MHQKGLDLFNSSIEMDPGSKTDFNPAFEKHDHLWSIILAGGNGDRISALVRHWMGRPIPKQYCSFVGSRSMLQHTLARADALGRREHQLVVIAKSHQNEALSQLADRSPGTIVVQPANRDTLPGIFLPLTHLRSRDSKATVVIYPSDHFVYPEEIFLEGIANAIRAVEELPHKIILTSVPADCLELEYGWISPGTELWRNGEYSLHTVRQFSEKPSRAKAIALWASGGLWNTMVIAAKVQTLWQLGWKFFPEILSLFERLRSAIGTSREAAVLDAVYGLMPALNFSADLLPKAAGQLSVISIKGIVWSDWGRAERIADTLRRIGKQPNFPMTALAS
jgi:mannose-1-phosphate guanylyltransferase